MKIGQLAKITGLPASKIRYYESQGLIHGVRLSNGYREYEQDVVDRIAIIQNAQQSGFTLKQIKGILPQPDGQWPKDQLAIMLGERIDEIKALEKTLKKNRENLQRILLQMHDKKEDVSCIENAKKLIG
ncbi:MAG: DNA-binding transcriptional MerR regulator [Bermanella sp.]